MELLESRVRPVGYVSSQWDVTVPPEVTIKDLKSPEYWAHIAVKFNPGDLLFVRKDDETHFGMFYVTATSRTHVDLHEVLWQEITKQAPVETEKYEYQWKGPKLRHCVRRKSDGKFVMENMSTKDAAMQWIINQNKAA